MERCTRRHGLEVHHRRRDGGNVIGNAQVLCGECHSATSTYGISGLGPAPFLGAIKAVALRRAGWRCECTLLGGCH